MMLYSRREVREAVEVPEQWRQLVRSFEQDLNAEEPLFPCTFGIEGLARDHLRFVFADLDDTAGLTKLAKTLEEFTNSFRSIGRLTSCVVFFPSVVEDSVAAYERQFWKVISFLHAHDPKPWPQDVPRDHKDPAFEFCFGGEPFFLFCSSPAYVRRRSRRSSSFVITFQPSWVFAGLQGKKGQKAREVIRARLSKYDSIGTYPALGAMSDKENREINQYFLPDSNEIPDRATCPFSRQS